MTEPLSQITIDDGTTQMAISGYATLQLQQNFRPLAEGANITRFLDGTAVKQTLYDKREVQITGNGWVPPGLESLDYAVPQTWTLQTDSGTTQVTVLASRPDETWDINAGNASWTLTGEEI